MKRSCLTDPLHLRVRLTIEHTFEKHLRWLNRFEISCLGPLDWVPDEVLNSVLREMQQLGILLTTRNDWPWTAEEFRTYILARLTVPQRGKEASQ